MSVNRHQLIALAAVFQSASLAKSLAVSGQCDMDALESSILSVLNTSPRSFEDIFPSERSVTCGLDAICAHMNDSDESSMADREPKKRRNMDIMRYATGLLNLEKKYSRQSEMQQRLGDGLDALAVHRETLGITEPAMISRLGQLYQDTISTLRPSIMVTGNPLYLRQDQIVSTIRTALLCGIRAASLWRSEGGSLWKLLFSWKKIIRQSRDLTSRS